MNGSRLADNQTSAGDVSAESSGEPPVAPSGEPLFAPFGEPRSTPSDEARSAPSGELRSASSAERRATAAPPPGRLNVAALRRAISIRMWGGKGSGLPCDFCRVLVGPEDVEYEVEAELDGATVLLRFHYRCHYAWTGGEDASVAADRA